MDSVGLWKGIDLEQSEKDMLEAVNERYPKTFQRVKIRSQPHWGSFLGALHVFIKRFLESSVDTLAKDGITSLEEGLDDFENLGFGLSWARERLEMVKNMKFGNDPLRLKLMVDEECVNVTRKEMNEASARLEKARLDYHKAVDNRTKTVNEVAQKFGAKYDDVLNGNLGFGMLPRH
ncbi:uncharacterized protein LOC143631781 [Bidens hawaiensis]|uniref:uncharacterized protein LOC143631781 n=1 Tax=Bidens hawaiensis TaxID=980011 RepID=UPI004049F6B6